LFTRSINRLSLLGQEDWGFLVSPSDLAEVAGEGCRGGGVPGCFTVPAALFGIGLERLDIVELLGQSVGEFGAGREVGAVLTDVRIGTGAGAFVPRAISVSDPGFNHLAVKPSHFVGNDRAADRSEGQLSAHFSDGVVIVLQSRLWDVAAGFVMAVLGAVLMLSSPEGAADHVAGV
jgi:hypothetical protein